MRALETLRPVSGSCFSDTPRKRPDWSFCSPWLRHVPPLRRFLGAPLPGAPFLFSRVTSFTTSRAPILLPLPPLPGCGKMSVPGTYQRPVFPAHVLRGQKSDFGRAQRAGPWAGRCWLPDCLLRALERPSESSLQSRFAAQITWDVLSVLAWRVATTSWPALTRPSPFALAGPVLRRGIMTRLWPSCLLPTRAPPALFPLTATVARLFNPGTYRRRFLTLKNGWQVIARVHDAGPQTPTACQRSGPLKCGLEVARAANTGASPR